MPGDVRQGAAAHESRAWCEVDLSAVRRNAERLRAHAGRPLAPVLKADAYGLGAVAVARALEPLSPWGYCVATLDEGAELRQAGIARPILVCPPLTPSHVGAARAHDLIPAIGTPAELAAWVAAGGGAWHLGIDTGMNRAGLRWDAVATMREAIAAHPPAGVFTHFHSADVDDGTMAEQERRFALALAALPARPPLVHSDNSAAAARRSHGAGDLVRPGLFLCGASSGSTARLHPDPVLSVRARIVELHEVPAGETVSYAGTWRATRPSRIATVAIGYADGYRRALGNRAAMLVHGAAAPVIGYVTMDMTMLDVTDVPAAAVGDIATVVGTDGPGSILLEDPASLAECSVYELLVAWRLRLPRVYLGAA